MPPAFLTAPPLPPRPPRARTPRAPRSTAARRRAPPPARQTQPRTHPHLHAHYTLERAQFRSDTALLTDSGLWRFLLLSDGHMTQHLSILTRSPITLDVVAERAPLAVGLHDAARAALHALEAGSAGVLQREIVLRGPQGVPLLYATSWWCRERYDALMRGQEGRPLYEVFKEQRLEVSRRILAVHYGGCPELEGLFGAPKDSAMWGKDYVFKKERVPFLVVHEVFSPALEEFLGPTSAPTGLKGPGAGSFDE